MLQSIWRERNNFDDRENPNLDGFDGNTLCPI
jgi:hypothetical protein